MPTRTTAPARPDRPASRGRSASRLAWLDALRGLAALVVVLHHGDVWRFVPHGRTIGDHFDLGVYGVMVFFLISGWIIPASLHRRGDVRGFWVGRLFRLYPLLFVVVLATMAVPHAYSAVWLRLGDDPGWSLIANATLLQDFVGSPSAISVMWTLGFEMIFYYLVSALFVLRVHTRSATIACAFALASLAFGGLAGQSYLLGHFSSWFARHLLTAFVVGATLVGLGLILRGTARTIRLGSIGLAAMGLTLLIVSSPAPVFETMTIPATMFAGTVVHALQHGTIRRSLGLGACAVVVAACTLSGHLNNRDAHADRTWTETWQAYTLPYVAAWMTLGVGILLSHRSWPRTLTWLGAVSYSLYIVHVPVMWFGRWVVAELLDLPAGRSTDAGLFVGTLVATLAISQVTYRFVELPGQRLGRRVAAKLGRRAPAQTGSG